MTKTSLPPTINILAPSNWRDYELLDSGGGMRLERFGAYILARPEAEAVWKPSLPQTEWDKAQAEYQPAAEENGGHWNFRKKLPERWQMQYEGMRFWAQTGGSRHVGVFPEQASQWDWIKLQVKEAGWPLNVLNLFGYTGLASLAAAAAGARVTHVDASRKTLTWAKENQSLSSLDEKPIRWILDDAVKFVRRDARRGATYDGIILDPPKFGRGPKGEVWEFYKLLPSLLEDCRNVLSPKPQFLVMTAYAVKASSVTLHNAVSEMMAGFRGEVTAGEVGLKESSAGRLLSMAVYARWQAER
jgi:23S rRNA (cytosine1962-C5)-methyltransferase